MVTEEVVAAFGIFGLFLGALAPLVTLAPNFGIIQKYYVNGSKVRQIETGRTELLKSGWLRKGQYGFQIVKQTIIENNEIDGNIVAINSVPYGVYGGGGGVVKIWDRKIVAESVWSESHPNTLGQTIETILYVDYELINKRESIKKKNKSMFYFFGSLLFMIAFIFETLFVYHQLFS